MAWWGHKHLYERTCAVYKEKCVKEFDKDDEIVNPGFILSPLKRRQDNKIANKSNKSNKQVALFTL